MKNTVFFEVLNLCRASMMRKLAAILAAAVLFCQVEAYVPPDAVMWYKGESNFTDTKGNTTAAPQGNLQYAKTGKDGKAFIFDGATAIRISNNKSPGVNLSFGASNFTVGVWVKFTATGSARIIYQNGYALNSAVYLQILADSRAKFFIRDDAGNSATVTSINPLNDDAWHYIAGVRSEKSALLYIDGVLQSCNTGQVLGNINASCGFHWLGGTRTYSVCATNATDQFFTGFIDEFHLIMRDLPGSEIKYIYDHTP